MEVRLSEPVKETNQVRDNERDKERMNLRGSERRERGSEGWGGDDEVNL